MTRLTLTAALAAATMLSACMEDLGTDQPATVTPRQQQQVQAPPAVQDVVDGKGPVVVDASGM